MNSISKHASLHRENNDQLDYYYHSMFYMEYNFIIWSKGVKLANASLTYQAVIFFLLLVYIMGTLYANEHTRATHTFGL